MPWKRLIRAASILLYPIAVTLSLHVSDATLSTTTTTTTTSAAVADPTTTTTSTTTSTAIVDIDIVGDGTSSSISDDDNNADNAQDTKRGISVTLLLPFQDGRSHLDFNGNEYKESIITQADHLRDGIALVTAAVVAIDDFNKKRSSIYYTYSNAGANNMGEEDSDATAATAAKIQNQNLLIQQCTQQVSHVRLMDTERLASKVLRSYSEESPLFWSGTNDNDAIFVDNNNNNNDSSHHAIIGIQNTQVAQELSAAIKNDHVPIISYGAWLGGSTISTTAATTASNNNNLILGTAPWEGRMKILIKYLETINLRYVALLYAPGDETQSYFPGLQMAAEGTDIQIYDAPSPRSKTKLYDTLKMIRNDNSKNFIDRQKAIIVAWERDDNIQVLADVASSLGMDSSLYTWIFLDSFLRPAYVDRIEAPATYPLARLLTNSRIFQVIDPVAPPRHYREGNYDSGATMSTAKQGSLEFSASSDENSEESHDDAVERIRYHQGSGTVYNMVSMLLQEMTKQNSPLSKQDSSLIENRPTYGAGFLYDSIIATGIAACVAAADAAAAAAVNATTNQSSSLPMSPSPGSDAFSFEGLDFQGVTGRFRIQNGVRVAEDLQYGIYFIQKHAFDKTFYSILYDRTVNGEWILGEQIENLYIPRYARVLGLILSGTATIFCLVSAGFVFRYRKYTVVRMGQPVFLWIVCGGAACCALSIVFRSFDDSTISDVHVLDAFCAADVWLIYSGQILVYMGLFSKMWRIKKVTAIRKGVSILPRHVILPFLFFIFSATGVLFFWILVDPPKFIRVLVGEFIVGENDGLDVDPITLPFCTFRFRFKAAMYVLLIFGYLLVFGMSYKTRTLPQELSDSRHVFEVLYAHFFITLGGLLMYATGIFFSSYDTAYFGKVIVSFGYSTTSVGFLILPKMKCIWRQCQGVSESAYGRCEVHVSGLDWDESNGSASSGFTADETSRAMPGSEINLVEMHNRQQHDE